MKNMGIGARLTAGFTIVVALFVANQLLAGMSTFHITKNIQILRDETFPFALIIDQMDTDRSEVQQFLTDVSATHDRGGYKEAEEAANSFLAGIEKFKQKYNRDNNLDGLKQIESIEAKFHAFNNKGKQMAETYIVTGIESGNLMMKGTKNTPGFDQDSEALAVELAKFREVLHAESNEFMNAVANDSDRGKHSMLIGSLIATALAIAFSIAITRSVVAPIGKMKTAIVAIGKEGDFTRRVALQSRDEIGLTANAFNELMAKLQTAFSEVREGIEKVVVSSHSLSNYSNQVAESSSYQNESTSVMAATVSQVTFGTSMVASGANEAVRLSRESSELSDKGGDVIQRAAEEMLKIADSVSRTSSTIRDLGSHSDQISTVVRVIKDIADQTNLLALNAAIEAARAGEMGRGFAVVADEVRKLAERTAKATQEVSEMINSIQHSSQDAVNNMNAMVEQVNGGVALAREAGESIVQIKLGSEQVTATVVDIANALEEQGKSSDAISAHIDKVSQMTENNTVAAKQASEAAVELQRLAEHMRTAVSSFKV